MSMRAGGDSNRRLDIEIGTQHIGRAVEQQAGPQFNFLVGPFFNRDNGQRLAFTSAFERHCLFPALNGLASVLSTNFSVRKTPVPFDQI